MGKYTQMLQYGVGYTGKLGRRSWTASITGTDTEYGLARDFLDADRVERRKFSSTRSLVDLYWELDPGLYEESDNGERSYFLVTPTKSGDIDAIVIADERAYAIARLLDSGLEFNQARVQTRGGSSP